MLVDQGDEVEIHAKNACQQVQGQEHGRQRREGAHDVVGTVALHTEVHLHHGFRALLQAAHMVGHALDVLDHVARAYLQQLTFARGLGRGGLALVQRFAPLLQGVALVFAHFVQLVQRQARTQQRAPVGKARMGPQQGGVPVVELAREFPAQRQKAIHHHVEGTQHQIRRAAGQARPGRCAKTALARVGGLRCQQARRIGIAHAAVVRMHRQQQRIPQRKAHGAGIDLAQHGRHPAPRPGRRRLAREARCSRIARALQQTAKHQQVVLRGVVVARGALHVQQV